MLRLIMRLRLAMKLVLLRMTSTVLLEYATLHHSNLSRQPVLTPLICALHWMLRV